MAPRAVPLEVNRSAEAAAVLARAFHEDDLFAAMFPDRATRQRKIAAYGLWSIRSHLLGGAVVETTSSLRGVCLWQPPGHSSPWWLGVRLLPQTAAFLWALGRDARRNLGWFTHEERRRQAVPRQLHWFLVMLGVEPSFQRCGVGAALALHGLSRADADGVPRGGWCALDREAPPGASAPHDPNMRGVCG